MTQEPERTPVPGEPQPEKGSSAEKAGSFGAWLRRSAAAAGTFFTHLWLKIKTAFTQKKDGTPRPRKQVRWFVPRSKEPPFLVCVAITTLRISAVVLLVAAVAGVGLVFGVAKAYWDSTQTLNLDKLNNLAETSFIYDCNGDLITEYKGSENRVWVDYEDIPLQLQNAYIAIEDNRFWTHNGVDTKRLAGAFINNLSSGSVQGGSTITQQLVKLQLLSSERTYKRKIQEAYLSIQLENELSKEDILTYYLNTIPLGYSNYGVKAAAKDYFGKDLEDLTLRECAALAATTANPYTYNVRYNYIVKKTPERINGRIDRVLGNMYQLGYITQEEYTAALRETLVINETSASSKLYDMPYFVEYAVNDVVTQMLTMRGLEDTTSNRSAIENELRTSGYKIYTTVDPEIQHIVEDTLYNWEDYPEMKNSSDAVTTSTNSDGTKTETRQPQAAAAVIDYRTGEIKAIVGGRDAPVQKKQLNRAYQAHMPVGSSIKPIAVYGPAIDLGASPASVVYNLPLEIDGWGGNGYPSNYGGGGFTGTVTLRYALRKSLNTAAAQTLMSYVGIDNSYNYLISLGVSSESIQKDGAGLALGTSGVTPIEMAAAFGTVANKGVYEQPLSFTRIEDAQGNVIFDVSQQRVTRQVFKPSTAYLLTDMLGDAVNNGTGGRARIEGIDVYGKTGTNSDYRGVFFSGFTPHYSAAVWIGSDNYDRLYSGASGGNEAAPLWQAFMSGIYTAKQLPNEPLYEGVSPEEDFDLVKLRTCTVSGLRATEECKKANCVTTDWWLKGTQPTKNCDLHITLPYCKEGEGLACAGCPEEGREDKVFMLIPTKSDLNKLKEEDMKKYLKDYNYVLEKDLLKDENNAWVPVETYECQLHNKQWQEEHSLKQAEIEKAQQMIAAVQTQLTTYIPLPEDGENVNRLILQLQALCLEETATAEQIAAKSQELSQAAAKAYANAQTPLPPSEEP